VIANLFSEQLESLVKEFAEFRARSEHDDCSDVMSETKAVELATRAYAAIERVTGKNSIYSRRAEEIRTKNAYEQLKVMRLVGVLQSLSADLTAGYLRSLEELVHGELFGDFLDMAQHLVQSGYKDAGAVVAGSSLEAHLRQLAKRFGVPTENTTVRGSIEPKKADLLNSDLVKAGAYSGLDQKNVTAWLDLRNKAAPGRYAEYQREQVEIMIDAVRNFMTRFPA
jgi:hypothetical protein